MVMTSTLVGRDAECAALRGALAGALSGRGGIVFVAGEAGAGKTRLVDDVLTSRELAVLRGRAAEWPCAAYDPIANALRPLCAGSPLTSGGGLVELLAALGAPAAADSSGSVAASVCAALAAAGRPLALFLDDLQWADEATLDVLPALGEGTRGLPVALVCCYRSDELASGHGLRTARARLRRSRLLTEITVGPLSDGAIADLIAGMLGVAPQPTLTAAVTSRSDGLPFVAEELVLALHDAGRLATTGGTVTLAGSGGAPIPDGVREAVLLRAARLSAPERSLLEAAAVAGAEFDIDVVVAASDADIWPDGFTAGGLMTEAVDGLAAFRHSLTREATYGDTPWIRRRRLHRRIASVLDSRGAPPALVAAHLTAARDFAAARPVLLDAAARHWEVAAYRDAARALRQAVEHWPAEESAEARLAVVDRLARCAEMCGDYGEAVALLEALADDHRARGNTVELAGTHRRLALVHEVRGQWEPALAERQASASLFESAGQPAQAAADQLAMAVHLRAAASYSAALTTLSAASTAARASGRADLILRADGLRGNLLCRLGRAEEGILAVRGALDQALLGQLSDTAAELHQRLADSIEHSGDYGAARLAYAAAYQFCDEHGADALSQMCRSCAAAVLFSRGEWDRAIAVCEDVLGAEAMPQAQAVATGMLGIIHALRGSVALARRELTEAGAMATAIQLTAIRMFSLWGLCVLADAADVAGRAAATGPAVSLGRQVIALAADSEERHYSLAMLPWLATFFARRGLASDALGCARLAAAIAEDTSQPEAVAVLAYARGETLIAEQPAAAVAELTAAAARFAELGLPLSAAQAQFRAAAAAQLTGDEAGAAQLLSAAAQLAGKLGVAALERGCLQALTGLGRRPARRQKAAQPAAGLSARELDVMRLVAQGSTSKEAGQLLFISPRTVEMHVQSSMLKLDCRTRAQAVRRLAEMGVLDRQLSAADASHA